MDQESGTINRDRIAGGSMENITPYHKIDSKLLEFDIDSVELKFGMWITKKEFGQRLNSKAPLPKGQFYMSVRLVAKDIDITEMVARRLIKQFTKLEIIRLISSSKNPKEGSIYEYLVQVENNTVENIVTTRYEHSKSEENQGFKECEGHSNNTVTTQLTTHLKRKEKENKNNIYTSFDDIEEIWSSYPKKRGKVKAVKKIEELLKNHDKENLLRAVKRYKAEVKGTEAKFIKNGDTFFNGAVEDYLDQNYEEPKAIENKSSIKAVDDDFIDSLYR